MRMRMRMIFNPLDFASKAAYTAAVDTYLVGTADIYINRAQYALDRYCEQDEFFLNVLGHQRQNGYQDHVPFPGFTGWPTP